MNIELNSLIGEHELSGAFFDSVNEPEYPGCERNAEKQVLRFTLDRQHYEAVQDPDDDYRSRLGELRVTDVVPQNTFPARKVVGVMKTEDKFEHGSVDHVLQFVNPATGKVVLEIGTTDVEDYYPGFVAYFSPENL